MFLTWLPNSKSKIRKIKNNYEMQATEIANIANYSIVMPYITHQVNVIIK